MNKFKNGDRVIKIENGKIRKGVIRRMFFDVEPVVALVDFDEVSCEKVRIDDIALAPETIPTEDENSEPIEKTEITITKDEFRDIAVQLAVEKSNGDFKLGMMLSLFSADIAAELFKADSDND